MPITPQRGAAAGARDVLEQIVAEQYAKKLDQQKQQQQALENSQRDRVIGQGDERNRLDQEQLRLASQPKPQGLMNLSPGASVFDPGAGRILTTAPEKTPPPDNKFSDWQQQYDYELAHPKPSQAQGAQPQIFVDAQGNSHAIQFQGGRSQEIPLPPGLSKTAPKGPEKLPQREDDTVVSIHQMMPLVDSLLSDTTKRIQAKGGPSGRLGQFGQKIARETQNVGYKLGVANQDPSVDKRIQLASLLQILGTVPYLRGIRNMEFVSQIQQHLADPTATDESISERLKTLKGILPGMEQAIYDVHNKGVIPHEHTGSMAPAPTASQELDYVPGRGLVPRQAK